MHLSVGICMKRLKQAQPLAAELRGRFERDGLKTSTAISKASGLGQSQVYRNLFGSPKKVGRTLRSLCKYAEIDAYEGNSDPRESQVLMDALARVWDGTDAHAGRLARLLFAHQQAHMQQLA